MLMMRALTPVFLSNGVHFDLFAGQPFESTPIISRGLLDVAPAALREEHWDSVLKVLVGYLSEQCHGTFEIPFKVFLHRHSEPRSCR